MKKKITALLLAVIMSLSFVVSAFAADTLKRVPSTIPGTDKAYNYVENITVKIPGTDVTFDFEKVADFVFVGKYGNNFPNYDSNLTYNLPYNLPVYCFVILESEGKVTFKQDGEWLIGSMGEFEGDGISKDLSKGDYFKYEEGPLRYFNHLETVIDSSNICYSPVNPKSENNPTALVMIRYRNYGGDKYYHGFDETIDISTLDVNYTADEEYKITDGANAVVNSDTKSLKITADGDFSKFTGVNLDGKIVDSSNYTASKGSTVVEFKGEYLKTLSEGTHTVEICFTDGKAATQFEIKKGGKPNNSDKTDKPAKPDVEIPNTDGSSPVTAVFAVMALSGTAVIAYNKKKRLGK